MVPFLEGRIRCSLFCCLDGGEQSFFNGANIETHLRGQSILGMFLAGVVQRGPGPDAFEKEPWNVSITEIRRARTF